MNFQRVPIRRAAGLGLLPFALSLFIFGLWFSRPYTQPAEAQADSDIVFADLQVDSNFPESLTFTGQAISSEAVLTRAEIEFFSPSQLASVSRTRAQVEITAGNRVELAYQWDTSGQTSVPNTPLNYRWSVWDVDGNRVQSPEQFVRYTDTRFEWQVEQNPAIAVWTHDRPSAFGQGVFSLAAQAVEEQRPLFGTDLGQQIQLIIYNDFGEFAEWHSTVGEFIGGQAFPDMGITTQIVPLSGPQQGWLMDVVPHEISHLYFAQATHNPTVSIPVWLNEGLAVYNEFSDQSRGLSRAQRAADGGDLVPLSSLTLGFGSHNEGRARLAYDEAYSAIVFMVERFGLDSLQSLMAAYRQGLNSQAAFRQAFGMDVGQFEAAWAEWLGVETGQYVTATPWPLPTFRPSPTLPAIAGQSATTRPSQQVASTATPTVEAAPTKPPAAASQPPILQNAAFLAYAALGLAGLAGLVWLIRRLLSQRSAQ